MDFTKRDFKGMHVLVAGSGISGVGAVKMLTKCNAAVTLYDGNDKLKKEDIEKSNQDAKNVENKIVTEIQKIKKVNTTIGNNTNNEDTNNKETDTNNSKKITRQDIQDIKKLIIDEYGVKEKCLEIN